MGLFSSSEFDELNLLVGKNNTNKTNNDSELKNRVPLCREGDE
jgi:hypothetical protein